MNESPHSGRPPKLADKQVDELLQALTDGAPLSSIVEGDEWPSYRSIFRRLEKDDEFRKRYDRARAIQAERWADELITLANSLREDATAEQIAATKLKIDTLKWYRWIRCSRFMVVLQCDVLARPIPVSANCCYRVSLPRKKRCQQIIGLNDESFSIAVRIDAKKQPVLGEMLGDAVGPAPCVQPISDDLPSLALFSHKQISANQKFVRLPSLSHRVT